MIDSPSNPYVGPRTFGRKHQHLFFGRDRESRELESLVLSERITLFYAPSGAGKSSIVNTRLVADLQNRGFSFYPSARVGQTLREDIADIDNIFIFNLLDSLTQGSREKSALNKVSIADFLHKNPPLPTSNTDETILIEHPPRVLIIDQFEEIITTHLDRWTERELFFKQVAEAVNEDPLLWIVFVLREDYVESLSPYAYLLPGRMQARYHMQRMGRTAALDAICKPAEISERPFTPAAAQQLLNNLGQVRTDDGVSIGEFIEPVQLQVVCYQLWEDLSKQEQFADTITLKDMQTFGDVDSALTHFYESTINDVVATTDASVLDIRIWFEHELITETGARGTVHQGAEKTGTLPNPIVKALTARFLLRPEQRAGSFWFELVHERFIAPIIQANARWLNHQQTAVQQAVSWHITGRPNEKLLSDRPVNDVRNELPAELATVQLVQDFLETSAAAQAGQHRVEAQRQEQEAKKSVRESRRRILFLVVFIPVAIFLISWAFSQIAKAQVNQATAEMESGTAVANIQAADAQSTLAAIQKGTAVADGAYAIALQQTAIAESDRADTLRVTAVAASTIASQQRATAEAARQVAEEAAVYINATRAADDAGREVAVEAASEASEEADLLLAQTLINEAGNSTDRELGALLLLHAQQLQLARHVDTAQVNTDLFNTLYDPGFNSTLIQHEGAINELVFAPASGTAPPSIASVGADGSLLLTVLGEETDYIEFQKADTLLTNVLFTPDGNQIITGGADGSLTIWAVDNPGSPLETTVSDSPVFDMIVSPDGTLLISSHVDGMVQSRLLTDFSSPPTTISTWREAASRPVTFDGGSGLLLIGDPDGAIEKWLMNGDSPRFASEAVWQSKPLLVLDGHDAGVAYLHENGKMRVERPVSYIKLEGSNDPSSLGVSPNGRFAAAGDINGNVSLWQLPDDAQLDAIPDYTFSAHNGAIRTVDWSPDSTLFATGGRDGVLRLWNATSPLFTTLPEADLLASSPTDLLTIAANRSETDDLAVLYDINALPSPLDTHNEDQGEITTIAFTPDGTQVALGISTFGSGMIRLGNLSAGNFELSDYRWFSHPVYAVAFSPNGRHIAVSGKSNGEILIYDLTNSDTQAVILRGHKATVEHLLFSADGNVLISATGHQHYPNGSQDEDTRIWDMRTVDSSAPTSKVLPSGTNGAVDMILSGDGTQLVTASDSIRIWQMDNTNSGSDIVVSSRLPSPRNGADRISFSSVAIAPDGRSLLATEYISVLDNGTETGSVLNRAYLWLLDTPGMEPLLLGEHLQTHDWLARLAYFEREPASYFTEDLSRFNSTSFSADSRYFMVAGDEGTMIGKTAVSWPSIICQQTRRELTQEEWLRYFDNRPYRDICAE